ncbi:MAG: hypothetical protein AAF515_04910 [Pseudomonadota bacterium]
MRARTPLLALLVGIAGLMPAVLTQAATQGTTGTSSTSTVDIHMGIGRFARITGFEDFDLGEWSGSGDMSADDNLCVGRNGVGFFGTGTYRIHAAGDGVPTDPAAFVLSNGVDQISYDAYFNDQPGTAGRQQLTPGVLLGGNSSFGFRLVFNYLFGCVIENANLSIVVPESELESAAGGYAGTLTLTLVPD